MSRFFRRQKKPPGGEDKSPSEPDIRTIVPMIEVPPIIVPKRLAPVAVQKQEEFDPAAVDYEKDYGVGLAEDSLEANEIMKNNA